MLYSNNCKRAGLVYMQAPSGGYVRAQAERHCQSTED